MWYCDAIWSQSHITIRKGPKLPKKADPMTPVAPDKVTRPITVAHLHCPTTIRSVLLGSNGPCSCCSCFFRYPPPSLSTVYPPDLTVDPSPSSNSSIRQAVHVPWPFREPEGRKWSAHQYQLKFLLNNCIQKVVWPRRKSTELEQLTAFNSYGISSYTTLQLPERTAEHRKRSNSSTEASKRTRDSIR